MSGTNPFRRKATADQSSSFPSVPIEHVPTSGNPESGITPIDTALAIKSKPVKTVRIISPHSAEEHDPIPDEVYDYPRKPLFSPPPDLEYQRSRENVSPEDPFAADSEGGGSGTEDEGTHADSLVKTKYVQQSAQIPDETPANPFKKTLSDSEPRDSQSSPSLLDKLKPSSVTSTPVRPQYDVEDFKKLLLTGEKSGTRPSPGTSAPPVSFSQLPNGDSNTDTSSTSQQSIFERTSSIPHESSQTSRESSTSIDGRPQLSDALELQTSKVKPAPPAHRHGKPKQGNGPQTTSFDDPSFLVSRSAAPIPISGDPNDPSSPTSPNDRSKALPALPLSSSPKHSLSDESKSRPDLGSETRDANASSVSQKKPVPAPPPSRRSRPISMASVNSGRSIPISEEGTADSIQFASSPPNRASTAPAPPPPRRSNTLRGDSSSSIPTIASIHSASDQSALRDQSPTPSQKPIPQVPLTRSPSITASKGGSQGSPASTSPAMGASQQPPPPPPRRRGSSQSSNHYIPSRLSGSYTMPVQERLRSDSGASSISHFAMANSESTLEQKAERKDVLADLTALQREVDELRGKIR